MKGNDFVLEMKGISKSFPGVKALNNVQLKVRSGTVHALMGENGAGKSTLMKILMGMYTEYDGDIYLKGKLLKCKNVKDAIDAGISMIHQELTYVPYMTIAENIFLGKEPTHKYMKWINKKELNQKTSKLLKRIGVNLKPSLLMKDLSVSERQMVEIAKAISYDADVIIMDEPTSAISDKEVEHLFKIIRELKNNGVAIIYISHKMDEIFEIADEITVLRDGEYIGTYSTDDIDINSLISLMVGRELKEVYPNRDPKIGPVIMEVKNLTKKGVFENISFKVNRGEILGIAGLMGSGRTEVMNCIFGLDKYDSGEIIINNKKVNIKNPFDAIRHGIGLISEDRKTIGLMLELSVKENIMLPNLRMVARGGFISEKKENMIVDKVINELSIKTLNKEEKVKNLSGGNQQKVVIGKTLLTKPNILILDEPTRGIDVGAKSEIYKIMVQLVNEGKSIIMVSSEMSEILGMSDRILVFNNGKIKGELNRKEANQEIIMKYAISHS